MRVLAIPAVLFLAACAHVDVGQVDYRVADHSMCDKTPCTLPLTHKYLASQAPFEKDDVYSIELEQAFIGTTLLEGVILGKEIGNRAEYAILANTFEMDNEGTTRFLEVPEFDGGASNTKMKLIYYGDDIARRQPFNFSNIPFMPRSVYNGGTIGIQIVVKELDNESPAITSLLETLADYGKTVVPGPPQLSSMLFDLGGSLLKGSKDDRLLDYRFELRNAAGVEADGTLRPTATFAPGRYVIRRSDDRATEMDWGPLKYDYDRGRLLNANGEEVRNEFYLVLNITKYDKATVGAEKYPFPEWNEEMRKSISEAANTNGAAVAVVTKHVTSMLEGRRSTQLRSDIASAWGKSDQRMRQLPKVTFRNLDKNSWACPAVYDPLKLKRDRAEQDIRDAIRAFVAQYQTALVKRKAEGAEDEGKVEISPADRAVLVSLVARSFMPWDGDMPNEFKSADDFETNYIAPGDGALAELAIKTMAGRAPESSCDDAKAKELAGIG